MYRYSGLPHPQAPDRSTSPAANIYPAASAAPPPCFTAFRLKVIAGRPSGKRAPTQLRDLNRCAKAAEVVSLPRATRRFDALRLSRRRYRAAMRRGTTLLPGSSVRWPVARLRRFLLRLESPIDLEWFSATKLPILSWRGPSRLPIPPDVCFCRIRSPHPGSRAGVHPPSCSAIIPPSP